MSNGKSPLSCHMWHSWEPTAHRDNTSGPLTRLPFYQLLPGVKEATITSFTAGVGACPPRHNHCLRQPLNEDRLAPLPHCTLQNCLLCQCVALASPPTLCFNIAVLSNKLARWHRVHTQLARQQSAWAIYSEMLWIFVYLPTSHYTALPQEYCCARVRGG